MHLPLTWNRRKLGLWVALFVSLALLLALLATGWNVVLVQDYQLMKEFAARSLQLPRQGIWRPDLPWKSLVLGTLGFVAALGAVALLFIKVVRETRLNQLQSEFLATVSHELKTPIAALELTSSLLRAGGVTAEEAETLWQSHRTELDRLREDVETLLQAARWQAHAPRLSSRRERLTLESWLAGALGRWRTLLGPEAELRRDGQPLDGVAYLDPRALGLITDNLLGNAKKYARGQPRITIRTRRLEASGLRRRPRWQIQIQDEGWGFDPSDSDRIFTRFFRSRTDSTETIPGTGLGLFLAATACRALGIELRGESPGVGRGATFTLEGAFGPGRSPAGREAGLR
jgi:signal transduction histidine kinase